MTYNRHRSRVAAQLTQTMGEFFRQEHLTDVVVKIESRTFQCHKLILAASSPVFDKMFSSEFKENKEGQVTLRDISPDTFEVILSYLYNEDDGVCGDNVHELLKAACMLQIDSVSDRCENFLVAHLTSNNCCEIWKLAESLNCGKLSQRTFKYMLKKFPKLSASNSFLEMEKSDLVKLFSHNQLRVVDEYDVAVAVVNWVKASVESRSAQLADIIQHVRFPFITADKIFRIQKVELPLLEKDLDCLMVLDEAKQYHMLPYSRHTFGSTRCTPRVAMSEVLLFPIGTTDDWEKQMILYEYIRGVWYSAKIGLGATYSSCTVVNMEDKIIVATAKGTKRMEISEMNMSVPRERVQDIFTLQNCTRRTINDGHQLPYCTSHNVTLFNGGLLLVISKDNSEKVYTYGRNCETVSQLLTVSDSLTSPQSDCFATPLRSQATATINNNLYIFGRKISSDVAGIQCLSMNNGKGAVWDVGEIPGNPENMLAITQDQTIVLVCSGGNVFRLTEDDTCHANIEHAFSVENLKQDFSAAIYQGCLYLATPDKELRQFDMTSGDLLSTKPIPCDISTLGMCGTVMVPKALSGLVDSKQDN